MIFTQPVVKEEMSGFSCDICSKVVMKEDDVYDHQEALHIDFHGGYASEFGDGNRVQCDICQHCLLKIIEPHMRVNGVKHGEVKSEA